MTQNTCPHCQQDTVVYITATSCHCTNRECNGFYVTLPAAEFMALTPAQLQSYQTGRTERVAMDIEQAEFELKMARLQRDLEARQAARVAGERVFG